MALLICDQKPYSNTSYVAINLIGAIGGDTKQWNSNTSYVAINLVLSLPYYHLKYNSNTSYVAINHS